MLNFSVKASLKALVLAGIVGGLVVSCNDITQATKPVVPSEEKIVGLSLSKNKATSLQSQDDEAAKKERLRKIDEFLAKPEIKEVSSGLEELAQAVAVAVEDKDLRERVYAKCMEKFDGESNVLWQQLDADAYLKSKGGWSKKIDSELGKGRKNTVVKGIGNVDVAIKKFEKVVNAPLHLFWAFPANWDRKTSPVVAFVPLDQNPKTRQSIPAFDAKGNRIDFDKNGNLARQRPVLIITFNERTSADGTVKSQLVATSTVADGAIKFVVNPNSKSTVSDWSAKNGSQLNSGVGVRVALTSLYIYPNWTWDEIFWDGASEFYCWLIQDGEVPDPTWGSISALFELGWTYFGNVQTNTTLSYNTQIGPIATVGFYNSYYYGNNVFGTSWMEDDFVYGPDPFDDPMCWHRPMAANIGFIAPAVYSFDIPNAVRATYRITTL